MDLSILQTRPPQPMGSGGRRRTFADMMTVVRRGALHGIVGSVFPPQEVAGAHRAWRPGAFFGKLVIES